uniref:ribosomal protein S15 n=1 Tax=Anemia phyllitidis TaxID=12940 RepID=UPI0021ABA1DA|nr:ribosomal protein S15 [Anemia phyllitidis]UUL71131.1 ribosomal protein S15 [Anemia phyllitidis]
MDKSIYINLLQVQKTEKTGSTQFQISKITFRVSKITSHLKFHPKDYSSQRGLWKLLGRRKSLLNHLLKKDFDLYNGLVRDLGIRGLKER